MGSYLGQSIYNDSQVTKEYVQELIENNGPGVFWVTYNSTTLQQIQDALTSKKLPVIKYINQQSGDTVYAPININGQAGYFTFSSGNTSTGNYIVFRLSQTNTWSMENKSSKDIFVCEIGQTTFATANDEYDAGKILFAKAPGVSVTVIVPMTRFNNSQFDFYGITEDSTFFKASLNSGGWSSSYIQNGMKDNGSKTESDIINGKFTIDGQNSTTKLTLSSVLTLTILSNIGVPDFAITIDNSANANDVSISVKTSDELTTLYHSTAGGTNIAAGSIVQLTAVGDCWTMAEFEA